MSIKDKIIKSWRDDSASASLPVTIFLYPIMLSAFMSVIDIGFYFINRAQVEAIARDGSRTVAIYAGNGTPSLSTPIEYQYGVPKRVACKDVRPENSALPKGVTPANYTAVECAMISRMTRSSGFVNVKLAYPKDGSKVVQCSPQMATYIGQEVRCTINWSYSPFPLSLMNFLYFSDQWEEERNEGVVPLGNNTTSATSVTESAPDKVGQRLVPRR